TYQWEWQLGSVNGSTSGTFTTNSPPYGLTVFYPDPTSGSGWNDIRVQDPYDGAKLAAGYFITFHNKYEDWAQTSSVDHPIGPGSNQPQAPDWTLLTFVNNPTNQTVTWQYSANWSTQVTESGTIGGQLVTQALDPIGFSSVQLNANITSSHQVTQSFTNQITYPVQPWTKVSLYLGPIYTSLAGTTSLWDVNGYQGDVAWSGNRVPTNVPASTYYVEAIQH